MSEGAETRQLMNVPSFETAFAFGWRGIRASITEWWGAYIAIAVLGAALTAWGASDRGFRSAQVEWLATFFALSTATRFAKPSFSMSFRKVCALLLICALIYVVPLLVGVGAFLVGISLIVTTKTAWPILALFPLFFVLLWVMLKLSLAPAFYTLRADSDFSIASPIRESWASVSGDTWWRVVGLIICVGLICGLVPGLLGIGAFFALQANPKLAALVAALIYYAGSIPGTIWTVGSFVALTTSLPEKPEPFAG